MTKLFISHASHDKALVESFVDLLEGGVGVPHRSIFCSSLKGQSIKPGTDFVESIRANLDEATCVLALISEAFYASAFCMCELGGVWLQTKSFLPVLVPPLDYADLKAVLRGLQVSRLANEDDLDELRDELIDRLGIEAHSTPRWNSKRKSFLSSLDATLESIRYEGPVQRASFNKLVEELESYRSEYKEREEEIECLEALILDLKKTKDAKAVKEIVSKHSSAVDEFEDLVNKASDAVESLPSAVQEALYYRSRGEDYYPDGQDAWDASKTPQEYGQLTLNSEENGLTPNGSNPKVRKAVKALDALERWLGSPPEEFDEWYEQEGEGEPADITLRSFWDRHLW